MNSFSGFLERKPPPTAPLKLPYIVAGEPPRLAVERPFPPAPLLLPPHDDDVTLGEGQLVLVGLLEGEARFHQRLATPAALRHVLRRESQKTWSSLQRRRLMAPLSW